MKQREQSQACLSYAESRQRKTVGQRCSGGAYIMEKDGKVIDEYVISDDHTTEFRMILTVMIHAMEVIPEGSAIVLMTNVAYIQNFDKEPTDKTANADLIRECISVKEKHKSAIVKLVPFHKYTQLPRTHKMAHEAMMTLRSRR